MAGTQETFIEFQFDENYMTQINTTGHLRTAKKLAESNQVSSSSDAKADKSTVPPNSVIAGEQEKSSDLNISEEQKKV